MKSNLQYLTIKLGAKATYRADIRGNFISFDALPAALQFRLSQTNKFVPAKLSLCYQTDGAEQFTQVEFYNPGGATLTFSFYFGNGAVSFIG